MATYEIIIKNDTTEGGGGAVAGQNKSQTKQESTPKNPLIGNATSSKVVGAGLVAWGKVKPWVNRVVSHEVSMVELRTGSRELQEKTSLTYQLINEGVDIGESALAGFFLSGGNPIGAIAGITLSAFSKVVNYAQNVNRINTERSVENIGIRQNLIRAGAKGSRSE